MATIKNLTQLAKILPKYHTKPIIFGLLLKAPFWTIIGQIYRDKICV